MPFFRQKLDIALATPREARSHDLPAITRLLREGAYHFAGVSTADLPGLVESAPVILLTADNAIWAVALASWPASAVTWLRGLALVDGLSVKTGLDALLPPFHALLRQRGVRQVYYAGDTAADLWMQPALQAQGYTPDTEVIVYEKQGTRIPSRGNLALRVRRAQVVDLASIIAVDQACFSAQWLKDEGIIGPSIIEAPFFVVAEMDGETVGYAFATTHFGNRLVHLVRIAVHPAYQGRAIGVRLLAEVAAFARTINAGTLALNTQADNYNAQRLYEWFGFRRTGERQRVLRLDL